MVEQIVGYIVLGTILLIALNFAGDIFGNFKDFLKGKKVEYDLKKQAVKYMNEKREQEKESRVDRFYGLIEFDFENCENPDGLRKDICLIIEEKMKSKYKITELHINATDKIFFNCNNFSIFDNIINDFIKLYNYFSDIHKKRHIKTSLKFSLWAKPDIASTQKTYKVLSEMNNLNYINQVICNDIVYQQYKKEKLKMFNFLSHGIITLLESDEDFELYRLLKVLRMYL